MTDIHSVPVKLRPAFFSYIWGGTLLRDHLNKEIPSNDIGESWEVSTHAKSQSSIASGPAAGIALSEYAFGQGFYGTGSFEKFPLLIKFLGASDNLSVQVHPSDANCRPGEAGKAEAWYVVGCEPGAELIYGIDCSREEFAKLVAGKRIADGLRRLPVKPGDVLDIPAGMVHALTAGIVVYEVQQNSDTTYRLYDWDRVDAKTGEPRELHINAALHVIDTDGPKGPAAGVTFDEAGGKKTLFIHNPRFTLERIEVAGNFTDAWFGAFAAYSVIGGGGSVTKDGAKLFDVSLGDSFIAPAASGPVGMIGKMILLKSHVPPEAAYQEWLKNR